MNSLITEIKVNIKKLQKKYRISNIEISNGTSTSDSIEINHYLLKEIDKLQDIVTRIEKICLFNEGKKNEIFTLDSSYYDLKENLSKCGIQDVDKLTKLVDDYEVKTFAKGDDDLYEFSSDDNEISQICKDL